MKLLFVDCALTHISPTATQMPALARAIAPAARLYGPGYSTQAELDGGLRRFVDAQGPFDAVLIGPNVPLIVDDPQSAVAAAIGYIARFTARQFSLDVAALFLKDVIEHLGELPVRLKLVSTLNFDYYAASAAQVDRLDNYGLALLGPNEQFVCALEDLPDFSRNEKHFVSKQLRLSNVWRNWLIQHPERVIPALHFVSGTEFDYLPPSLRQQDVAVPGAGYFLRQQAEAALKANRMKSAGKWPYLMLRAAAKLGLPVFNSYLGLHLFNFTYCRTLAQTRFVYTARGGFGIPVRKYLEIPAAGALLICVPCNGLDVMGYVDGHHYVHAEPGNLPAALEELAKEPDRVDAIARCGQDLTYAAHSLEARAVQARDCMAGMLKGTFAGASWDRGTLKIREKVSCAG